MSRRVNLKKVDGGQAVLVYEEGSGGKVMYELDTMDEGLADAVHSHMLKEREFKIPESNEEGDYRVDVAVPIDGLIYFELSLSTLYAETGIKVG